MLLTICTHIGKYWFISSWITRISSFSSIVDDQRHTILADCDDDGETGASSRMLHLMDVSHSFSSNESRISRGN